MELADLRVTYNAIHGFWVKKNVFAPRSPKFLTQFGRKASALQSVAIEQACTGILHVYTFWQSWSYKDKRATMMKVATYNPSIVIVCDHKVNHDDLVHNCLDQKSSSIYFYEADEGITVVMSGSGEKK